MYPEAYSTHEVDKNVPPSFSCKLAPERGMEAYTQALHAYLQSAAARHILENPNFKR